VKTAEEVYKNTVQRINWLLLSIL